MKVITVTGKGPSGELQPFHIVNPTNLVINTGKVQRPGTMQDGQGNPLMIEEVKTFIHIAGAPLTVEETIEEVLKKFND